MRKGISPSLRSIVVLGALLAALTAAPAAEAAIPSSLKSSCVTNAPHPGYSYKFCDDGIPPSGGTTPNAAGTNAVEVPAKYVGWEGLPAKSADANTMPGADPDGNIALDVDISVPTVAAPPGGYPLMVMMHGCCAGDKTGWKATSFDAAGEKWHYNNAWFASRGYVVITYTARGFVNGTFAGDDGSTGETQLDSRRFEINDFQHLAGQVADDSFFNINPQKVVTTGGSYGGGFSWLALTDPIWTSPNGLNMKLAASAPKYGWTDLVYSLVPTGRHSQSPSQMPAFDGSDSTSPFGVPKKSINGILYDSGTTGIPPGSSHTTFPPYILDAFACLNGADPYETNPICAGTIATTLPSFINDRSAYYQNDFFTKIASDPNYRIPVFNAATFTDPLFTPVENRRMANRLLATVPNYPIKQYYGDYQHFVQNKAKEWGDICGADRHVCTFADYTGGNLNADPASLRRTGATTRLNRFVDHYAQPPGNASEPAQTFDVTATLQTCPDNASAAFPADEPGETFVSPRFEGLAPRTLQIAMSGNQTTVNNAEPNSHSSNSDPVFNFIANGGRCPVETTAAGAGVATYTSEPLARKATMVGATTVSIDYSATSASGLQLNSRLYDVFPNGRAVMVDRGVRRVTSASGTVTYQLHGNGWRFPAGHRVRIEIAQDDDPFVKASTVTSSATLTGVTLQIPIRENYDVPQAASSIDVDLVPAFRPTISATQCAARGGADSTHGAPLSFGSCNPPAYLPGTAAQLGTQAMGFAQYTVVPGNLATVADEADMTFVLDASDVRNRSTGGDYTPNAGGPDVTIVSKLRLSDSYNGPMLNDPGTPSDFEFPVAANCAGTSNPAVGSTCSVSTTADAVTPDTIREGKESVLQVFRVRVEDSGANGTRGDGDDRAFAHQGVYIP